LSINLLDRFHQAVSFPEMVLALQTKSGAATLDYSCSDEMVTLDAADATRPMLGALLQTGWGVAPTHEHFSGKKQSAEVNFVWSAANTPFGPFSASAKLNFAVFDAARRNLVFSALNASLAQVFFFLHVHVDVDVDVDVDADAHVKRERPARGYMCVHVDVDDVMDACMWMCVCVCVRERDLYYR